MRHFVPARQCNAHRRESRNLVQLKEATRTHEQEAPAAAAAAAAAVSHEEHHALQPSDASIARLREHQNFDPLSTPLLHGLISVVTRNVALISSYDENPSTDSFSQYQAAPDPILA